MLYAATHSHLWEAHGRRSSGPTPASTRGRTSGRRALLHPEPSESRGDQRIGCRTGSSTRTEKIQAPALCDSSSGFSLWLRPCGALDRFENARLGATPANISIHRLHNLLFGGAARLMQQRSGSQYHARGAVAALEGALVKK